MNEKQTDELIDQLSKRLNQHTGRIVTLLVALIFSTMLNLLLFFLWWLK